MPLMCAVSHIHTWVFVHAVGRTVWFLMEPQIVFIQSQHGVIARTLIKEMNWCNGVDSIWLLCEGTTIWE